MKFIAESGFAILTKYKYNMPQLVEIQYFGCIALYVSFIKSKHTVFEQYESFQKMSYRNRCQVLGAGKVLDLTVPLIGGRDQKAFTKDIRIDNGYHWQVQHWRTLESCYNKSPFFFYYRDSLEALLFQSFERLWDLDLATINWVVEKLKFEIRVEFSGSFKRQVEGDTMDYRNRFKPSNRKRNNFSLYQQVFDNGFETNLCILDLLFNLGPASLEYLLKQGDAEFNYR